MKENLITPGSQLVLESGLHLMLHNDGRWHDTASRSYEYEQLPEEQIAWAYDAGKLPVDA